MSTLAATTAPTTEIDDATRIAADAATWGAIDVEKVHVPLNRETFEDLLVLLESTLRGPIYSELINVETYTQDLF